MHVQQRVTTAINFVAAHSINATAIAGEHFDVTVIGAGPAGALAARQLAAHGLQTLLVDKNAFPRHKVCGCCISSAAVQVMEIAGLDGLLDEFGPIPLHELQLAFGAQRLKVPIRGSRSLSRKTFDLALVEASIECGAKFLPACTARIGSLDQNEATVVLMESESGQNPVSITTKVIIVADGIGGTSLQSHPSLSFTVRPSSRVGIGTVSNKAAKDYDAGSIFMACGSNGYLGLVRLEDGTTDLAAAFDPVHLRRFGNPAQAAADLLATSGWITPSDIDDIHWQGTVPLTRHRRTIAATRVFAIGDAASYVEPFTGEGIGWALSSALLVVPLALRAAKQWDESLIWRWHHTYSHLIRGRQRSTRLLSEVLRHTNFVSFAGNILNKVPSATTMLAKQFCATFTPEELQWLRS